MIKVEGSKMIQLTILDPLLGGLQVQPFQALSAWGYSLYVCMHKRGASMQAMASMSYPRKRGHVYF